MRIAATAVLGGLLLSACAPIRPTRPEVPAFTPLDCASLYPHPDAIPDLDPAAPTPAPAELAAQGEARLALARFLGCQQDNTTGQDRYLAAIGKQLQYDRGQMQADIAGYEKRNDADVTAKAQYQADCSQPELSHEQYLNCMQRAQDLNAELTAANSVNSGLKARNDALNARIQDYDQEIGPAPGAIRDAYALYNAAVKSEGAWLDRARYLVSSPEYRSTAQAAGCPDIAAAPRSVEAMHDLAESLIACLKRVSAARG